MKPQDLVIESLEVDPDLTQGWGTLAGRRFQFHAKYGSWEFSVFEDGTLTPWDRDIPSEHYPGMYITQPQKRAMTKPDVERIITRCADAYLFMIGRRQSDLSEPER